MLLCLSSLARQSQITTAARALVLSWFYSVVAWRLLNAPAIYTALALGDAALAVFFWRMSRGRWFPVPLFAIHVVMLTNDLGMSVFAVPEQFIGVIQNRLFELAVFYVGGCALYRIYVRHKPSELALKSAASPRRSASQKDVDRRDQP